MSDVYGGICFFGPDTVGQQVNGEWQWFKTTGAGWVPTELPAIPDNPQPSEAPQ